MADDTSASIRQLHQPPRKIPKTSAQRQRECRERKKQKAAAAAPVTPPSKPEPAPAKAESPPPPTTIKSLNHAILLKVAAVALGAVGVTMNGWSPSPYRHVQRSHGRRGTG